jgi:hypothetical protein
VSTALHQLKKLMSNRRILREKIDGEKIDGDDEKGESSDIIQELMLITSTVIPFYKE